MTVAKILAEKGSAVISIKPTATIEALSALLRERRIGAVVVSNDGVTVDGVISERDIAYSVAKYQGGLFAQPVSELMTKTVITCSPKDPVGIVGSTMLSRNIRHIPVVDGQRLVGMVSIRDVLNLRVDELQQKTAMLHSLVTQVDREPQDR